MDLPSLSLSQKVAQLIVVRASGHLFDRQIAYPQWEACQADLRGWIEQGVGGVILLGGSAAEISLRTEQIQGWADLPLFMAADVEEGVGQRFAGATALPPPLAFGAIVAQDLSQGLADTEQFGSIVAQEAAAIGLNWILAPVVDVNNNPQNPVINVRSFGETAEGVSALAQAFLRGCQGYPVLTTAKHFPGHGDTAVDSHLELPQILHDRSRLEAMEWKPFRAAIEAGVPSIMTAHLLLPALDPDYPATLSRKILTGLLRQTWGFEGLIVTDALIMQAITQHYGATEAPILALEAGADVILMPVNPSETIAAIVQAVETGRLSEARIDQSLERIWQAKRSIFSAKAACPPPTLNRLEILATPEGEALTRSVLERSQQCRISPNLSSNLPADPGASQRINLILVDNLLQAPFLGNHTPAVQLPQRHGYGVQCLDQTSTLLLPSPQDFPPGTSVLLQLFVRGNPFRGSGETSPWMEHWLTALRDAHCLTALVIYGSPYAAEALTRLLSPEIPSIFTYGQMPLAQEIALESLLNALIAPRLSQNKLLQENPIEFTT